MNSIWPGRSEERDTGGPAGPAKRRVAVYFVASPLHYLAARRVSLDHEAEAFQVLVCYRPTLAPMIQRADWDEVVLMPWPRFEPLPGLFGRVRATLRNLRQVAAVVEPCEQLVLHSPVYDTEAINYFLRALPLMTGARSMQARILPDGILNLKRHPLNLARRLAQWVRRLRWFANPLLNYTRFQGDRIGSDAPFVDRIYVLNGFPHEYQLERVVTLAPLVTAKVPEADSDDTGADQPVPAQRALVLGQPLVAVGLLSEADRVLIAQRIGAWLAELGVDEVYYKPHPREGALAELGQASYQTLVTDEPLEQYIAGHPFSVVVGCCSTGLFTARQILGEGARIAAFGVDRVRFKTEQARQDLIGLSDQLHIERPDRV